MMTEGGTRPGDPAGAPQKSPPARADARRGHVTLRGFAACNRFLKRPSPGRSVLQEVPASGVPAQNVLW
jgi:hypothetical protein